MTFPGFPVVAGKRARMRSQDRRQQGRPTSADAHRPPSRANSAVPTSISLGQLTKSAHPLGQPCHAPDRAFKFGISGRISCSARTVEDRLWRPAPCRDARQRAHLSSRFVSGLVATADRQQSILHESITTEVMLQTAQIAGRDVRRAQTVRQVDEHLAQLQKISDQARERIIALQLRAESDATRKKLERVNGLILEYVAAAREIGAKQTEILSLFQRLDEAETHWTRAFHQLVNSDAFSLLPNVILVEALINEASSGFQGCANRHLAVFRAERVDAGRAHHRSRRPGRRETGLCAARRDRPQGHREHRAPAAARAGIRVGSENHHRRHQHPDRNPEGSGQLDGDHRTARARRGRPDRGRAERHGQQPTPLPERRRRSAGAPVSAWS